MIIFYVERISFNIALIAMLLIAKSTEMYARGHDASVSVIIFIYLNC